MILQEKHFVQLGLNAIIEEDVDQQAISTRKDSLPSKNKHENSAIDKLTQQFERFNVFRIHINETVSDSAGCTDDQVQTVVNSENVNSNGETIDVSEIDKSDT